MKLYNNPPEKALVIKIVDKLSACILDPEFSYATTTADNPVYISMFKLESILSKKKDSAPEPDGTSCSVLNNLPPETKAKLLKIYDNYLEERSIPN